MAKLSDRVSRYTSAHKRLTGLPAAFRGAELGLAFGWTPKQVAHYLWLWKSRGLVQALGGHSDVYANLVFERSPDEAVMLLMAMPSAIRIGADALRLAGWTTQIEHRPTVAVRADAAVYSVNAFSVQQRSAAWFDTVQDGIIRPEQPLRELRTLKPAWALADMLAFKSTSYVLAPDDIDWDEVGGDDAEDWSAASKALGLEKHPLSQKSYEQLLLIQ